MQLETLTAIAARYKEELPSPVYSDLRDVEVLIAPDVASARAAYASLLFEDDTPTADDLTEIERDIPLHTKGLFIGEPMEREEASNEDDGEESVTLPEGVIVLVASNIDTPEEAARILLHETAHAMGKDEAEVEALGLGEPVPPAPEAQ